MSGAVSKWWRVKSMYAVAAVVLFAGAAPARAVEVGVIPQDYNACPSGSVIRLTTDDEDHNNQNNRSGWIGATVSGGNTEFRFCRVDGSQFKPLATFNDPSRHYMVLKLGDNCPAGSNTYYRDFHNETHDNRNRLIEGNPWPSYTTRGDSGNPRPRTHFEFCVFTSGSDTMATFPNVGFDYGVFAKSGFLWSSATGWFSTDDQDGAGNGSAYGELAGQPIVGPVGASATRFYTARVTGSIRPVARCSATPSSGVDSVESAFQDAGSYARAGRSLQFWSWAFSDGSTATGTGPVWMWAYAPEGGSAALIGTLTVTDDHSESSSTTCSVVVTSSTCPDGCY